MEKGIMINEELIKEIIDEMYRWYGFDLTYKQVKEYLDYMRNSNNEIDCFDTYEREGYSDYLAKKITGMSWPMNMDGESYKREFYTLLKEKSKDYGYIWEH